MERIIVDKEQVGRRGKDHRGKEETAAIIARSASCVNSFWPAPCKKKKKGVTPRAQTVPPEERGSSRTRQVIL